MARPRKYNSDAERQAAHRARVKVERAEVDRRALEAHHARLDRLQRAIYAAARQGDAAALAGRAGSVDTMLDKLAAHFEAVALEAAPDLAPGRDAQPGPVAEPQAAPHSPKARAK